MKKMAEKLGLHSGICLVFEKKRKKCEENGLKTALSAISTLCFSILFYFCYVMVFKREK